MWRQQIIKQIGKKKGKQVLIIIITIPLAGFTAWLFWLHQVFPLLWPSQVSQILPYIWYMSPPCPLSAVLQTLWSLIFTFSSPLSLCFLPHPCISSPSASICFVSSSGTLYTPVSLLTSLFSFPILALSGLFNLDSALSLLQPPPSPPSLFLSVHWTWINSSQCSPWQRGPQSVTPPAWGTTVLLWHCHIRVCHAQTYTQAPESCMHMPKLSNKTVCVSVCLLTCKCVIWFVFSMSEFRCASSCSLFARASSKFTFQPSCMHMHHLLFRIRAEACVHAWVCVCDIQFTAFTTNCSKKMCRSLYPAVGAVPTCCNCGLCKHSTLITIRELSLNSLAPWLVWRAKICIQSKALECIRVILLHRALRREQCLSKNRALSV